MDNESRAKRVKQILTDCGAYLKGHFVLASGKHCGSFINSAAINSRANALSELGLMIADEFRDDGIEIIAGPATGSIGIANFVAYHLNIKNPPLTVYTETVTKRDNHKFTIFRRGFRNVIAGKRVLFVDDVVITGESSKHTVNLVTNNKIDEVKKVEIPELRNVDIPGKLKGEPVFMDKIFQIDASGIPVGAAVICNRGGCTAESLGVPKLISLIEDPVKTWSGGPRPGNCDLCDARLSVNTEFGKGAEWVLINGQPDTWTSEI